MAGAVAAKSDAIFDANRAVGSISFAVKQIAGKTRRAQVYEAGSLRVRCPGAPADELEAVIINTAGGVAGGDRLRLDIAAGQGTRVVVTTAAAEKVYRTLGPDSTIDVKLDVAAGASLDWLPQETILFDRARLRRSIEVDLAPDARLFLAEAIVFGRSGMGEAVEAGRAVRPLARTARRQAHLCRKRAARRCRSRSGLRETAVAKRRHRGRDRADRAGR